MNSLRWKCNPKTQTVNGKEKTENHSCYYQGKSNTNFKGYFGHPGGKAGMALISAKFFKLNPFKVIIISVLQRSTSLVLRS